MLPLLAHANTSMGAASRMWQGERRANVGRRRAPDPGVRSEPVRTGDK